MTEEKLDLATAQSTYKIITALIEQVDAASSLIALMASVLGETTTKQITETAAWANYLTARRSLETLQPELHKFVVTVNRLTEEQPEKPQESSQ